MKKILYAILSVMVCLSSCTKFDDPVTENYGDGPAITIDVTTTADESFTFALNPAQGTQWYSYVVVEDNQAQELDPSTLLKGGYSDVENAVIESAKTPNFTSTVSCTPNTTYYIYAVAASDKGIVGDVAVKSVTTSDAGAPFVADTDYDGEARVAYVAFSEAIFPGTSAVKAVLYKEFDILNPIELTEEDFTMTIEDHVLSFDASGVPAGAYVTFSWEAGAFEDAAGNKCAAQESGLNMTTGNFVGVYVHNDNVPFEVTDKNVTSPEDGLVFPDWKKFEGKLTFDFDIYRVDELVEDGAVSVMYHNAKKDAIHKLSADQWSVSGKTLTFSLPVAPEAGDIVEVLLSDDAIFDVYGNPNSMFLSDTSWKYFAMTKDMAYGSFTVSGVSSYDGPFKEEGVVTISPDAESEEEDAIIVKNLVFEDSEVCGYVSVKEGKVYLENYSIVGVDDEYGYIIYNMADPESDYIPFEVNADGTLSSKCLAIVACDVEFEDMLGYADKYTNYVLTPAVQSSKVRKVAATHAKSLKGTKLAKSHKVLRRVK